MLCKEGQLRQLHGAALFSQAHETVHIPSLLDTTLESGYGTSSRVESMRHRYFKATRTCIRNVDSIRCRVAEGSIAYRIDRN